MLTAIVSTDTDETFVLDLSRYHRDGVLTVYEVTDNSRVELTTIRHDDPVDMLVDWLQPTTEERD